MIKLQNKLLIIFLLFHVILFSTTAQSVPALFPSPVKSVKFGEDFYFSFIPIGWSKDGHCAFLLQNRKDEEVQFMIEDAVSDTELYLSDTYSISTLSIPQFWEEKGEYFSKILSQYEIVSDRNPRYGSSQFNFESDSFTLFQQKKFIPGIHEVAELILFAESEKRGRKKLYKYVRDSESPITVSDSFVLGFYKSPLEKRILVISLDLMTDKTGTNYEKMRFNGAHLTLGFTGSKIDYSQLTEAVLSGQYYRSRALLEKGADPDIAIVGKEALVLLAAAQKNWDLVFLLIQYGAEPAVVDIHRRTLLHLAVLQGDKASVMKLLEIGLNRDFKDDEGQKPVDIARKLGYEEIVSLLD